MKQTLTVEKRWTEVIIDGDCDFDKFNKVAGFVETKLGLVFSKKLNDLETIYWDFDYNNTSLVLFYNIYEGVTIFPRELENVTEADNKNAAEVGNLLLQELTKYNWTEMESGRSIGSKGSEGGIIIADFENTNGARITLEKECGNIPFAITLGVYGLMFHTLYESDLKNANEYVEQKKLQINKVFELYDIPEEKRLDSWNIRHNKLMDKLTDITEIQVSEEQKQVDPMILPKEGLTTSPLKFWNKLKFWNSNNSSK